MTSRNRNSGIGDDRNFIDAYYIYTKLKMELDNPSNDFRNDSIEEIECNCCKSFLNAIIQCLDKINSLPEGDIKRNYLDYLRWNNLIILTQLYSFSEIAHLHSLLPEIKNCEENIETTIESYFRLNSEERGVSNQYVHALNVAKDLKIRPVGAEKDLKNLTRALQHTGRLLINYVNYLLIRGYSQKLDRTDITYVELKNEAVFVITELQNLDDNLALDITRTLELYEQFRTLDECNAEQQDRIMAHALKLAHARATETRLQTLIREISHMITIIKEVAAEKIQEGFQASKMLTNPMCHPIETINNFFYALRNIKRTTGEILKWARENPWRSTCIMLGGVLIGAFGVGVPLTLSAYCLDLALTSVTLSPTVFTAIGVTGTFAGTLPVVQTAVAGANAVKIREQSEHDLKIAEAKEALLKAKNVKEGEIIASDVVINKHRRDYLRRAYEMMEEQQVKKMRESEKQVNEVIRSQFYLMDEEGFKQAESQLNVEVNLIENNLVEIRSELQESNGIYAKRG